MTDLATLFKDACETNEIGKVKFCLRNEDFQHDQEALHEGFQLAVQNNHVEIIKWLLNLPQINESAELKYLALKNAARNDQIELVERLLADAEVKASIASDDNFLVEAGIIYADNDEMVQLLLKVPECRKSVSSALNYAATIGKNDILRQLTDIAFEEREIISDIMQYGNSKAINEFIEDERFVKIAKTQSDVEHFLLLATQRGDTALIKALCENLDSETKSNFLPLIYESSMSTLSKMIFFEKKQDAKYIDDADANISVVYNNDGYYLRDSLSPSHQKGNPLSVEVLSRDFAFFFSENNQPTKKMPIGYNIHLPPQGKTINNVIVHVYGGGSIYSKDLYSFHPGQLYDFENQLLEQGTAVVKLNLSDLLKEQFEQNKMNIYNHDELHKSINQFYQTLKESPESLHPSLAVLKNKDAFLYGMSFGGRTAVRHAQLYPNTFKGYISHDGVLSGKVDLKGTDSEKLSNHLDPANFAQNVQDPVLLMHNMDDNNVNVKVTLDFYQKMVEKGKFDLARLYLTPVGSAITEDDKIAFTGHFMPADHEDYIRYIETLTNFMSKGPSALPAISEWRAYHSEKLANKFYMKGTTLQQKFVAEVLHKGKADPTERAKMKEFALSSSDDLWEKHYKPLFYGMHYANKLAHNEEDLNVELLRLEENNLLTDEVIKKVLASQALMLCAYLKERYGIDISVKEVIENDQMIPFFRQYVQSLASQRPEVVQLILNGLYQAEPQLLAAHHADFKQDPELQEGANQARDELKNTLVSQRKMVAYAWRQAAKESLKKDKSAEVQTTHQPSTPRPKKL